MSSSGCSLSLQRAQAFSGDDCPGLARHRDAFGGTQWPTCHIRLHMQKNANRVSCAACLELVQVQTQTITSQERNGSLLWMRGGVDGDASAVQDGGIA